MPGTIILAAVACLMIGLVIVGYRQAAKRREALRRWARSRGFAFTADKDYRFDARFPDFDCLQRGEVDRYAFNIIRGEWRGRPMVTFDYHYATTSSNGKSTSRRHHRYSAVILASDLPLEPMLIRPERIIDRVAGFFGMEDIDFESAAFSREFHVKAADRRWAYDVLHPRTIQMLLDRPRFTIQMDRGHVIATRDSQWDPPVFGLAADVATDLLDALPDYLRQQQREQVS